MFNVNVIITKYVCELCDGDGAGVAVSPQFPPINIHLCSRGGRGDDSIAYHSPVSISKMTALGCSTFQYMRVPLRTSLIYYYTSYMFAVCILCNIHGFLG